MFASFCCIFLYITIFTRPVLPILGICFTLFASNDLTAQGQILQNSFQPPGYLESLQYHASLSETNFAFFEFSGSHEIDDALQNFFAYLVDPINRTFPNLLHLKQPTVLNLLLNVLSFYLQRAYDTTCSPELRGQENTTVEIVHEPTSPHVYSF